MNIFDSIVHQLNEVDYKGVVRKQRSINRLFPDWADKVKGIAKMGGLRMKSSNSEEWYFQVHSGTEKDTWYDVHLQFKNVKELLAKYVKDRRIWVKDKTRIDRRKLAKKMLYNMDIAFSCSCPAAQYWGSAYITSLPKYAAKYGEPETRAPKIRNPKQYGMVCKHLQNIINVLPFYETTMSQWLKEFYEEDITRIEQEASKEAGQFKQAGAALGKKIEEPEKPVKEPIKPTMKARPRVKKTKKPEIPTMKTALVKKKLKDKGIGQTKESLSESLNWQKTGTHTSSLLIGKYNITLRPNRSISKVDYGKSYSIFIEEAWPGEKNVWKKVETIEHAGSYSQAKKKAEEWLRNRGLLENLTETITEPYGGFPSGGYYSSNTEYEIGLQTIAESLHCIMGSCMRSYPEREHLRYEKTHIEEELNIIQRTLQEYGRDLYIDQLVRRGMEDEYVSASRDSIRTASIKLYHLSVDKLVECQEIKEPDIREIVKLSIITMTALAKAAVKSIDNYPNIELSAFKDQRLVEAFRTLKDKTNSIINRKESNMESKTKPVKESNTFQISSSNSAGDLQVLSSKGVKYKFFGVNPPAKEKIEKLLRHKAYGKAWQMLKGFEMEKL